MPTNGVPTANTIYRLPDGAALLLTVALEADRTGRTYEGPLPPDVQIWDGDGDEEDEVLIAATNWLSEQPSCG